METKLRNPQAEVRNHGQIDQLTLPEGWTEGESQSNVVGNSSFRQFHPADNKEVALCLFYAGRPLDDRTASFVRTLIEQPAHDLTQSEIASAAALFREKANPADFSISAARTEDLNGKHVLIIEGRYKLIQQSCLAIYVDAEGSGKFVQEIFFQAPAEVYEHYLEPGKQAINSIEWKP